MKLNRFAYLLVLGLLLLASGCAQKVHKSWAATGGSRADATVDLSFDYVYETEEPIIDEAAGLALAEKRCQAWGYSSAEPFGGAKVNRNLESGGFGTVTRIHVTKTYQCLGKGDKGNN